MERIMIDIMNLLTQQKELKETIDTFFERECKWWKSFSYYVVSRHGDNLDKCPFFYESEGLHYRKGVSCLDLDQIYINPIGNPDSCIRFCFTLICWDDEWEREVKRSHVLDVPITNVTNFTQEDFDKWIVKIEKEYWQKQTQNTKDTIKKLTEKYLTEK